MASLYIAADRLSPRVGDFPQLVQQEMSRREMKIEPTLSTLCTLPLSACLESDIVKQ